MTDTSTWQPARPSGSNSSSNGGGGAGDGPTAQGRAGARGPIVAALLLPFEGITLRRRRVAADSSEGGGEREQRTGLGRPWHADPLPLSALWARTRAAAAAERAEPLPDDPAWTDRLGRHAILAVIWAWGLLVRLPGAAAGYLVAWVTAEPSRFVPVALIVAWVWWTWGGDPGAAVGAGAGATP